MDENDTSAHVWPCPPEFVKGDIFMRGQLSGCVLLRHCIDREDSPPLYVIHLHLKSCHQLHLQTLPYECKHRTVWKTGVCLIWFTCFLSYQNFLPLLLRIILQLSSYYYFLLINEELKNEGE